MGFFANVGLVLVLRRRTRAINAVRVISVFLIKHAKRVERSEDHREKELAAEIRLWLQYPNAQGSEAQAAKLVAEVQVACGTNRREIGEIDRALNALDQRATERERRGS